MRIIILGAGQVGGTLAQSLLSEDNDITLIDLNNDRLAELQHRLDIQTINGSAAHPDILIKAGIEQADMLIAVTDSDEINMMACQIAYTLFRTPTKIARIRSKCYYQHEDLFSDEHVPVDVRISPEALVTEHIENLINYSGVSRILDFAQGKVLLVTIKPFFQEEMLGKTIAKLKQQLTHINARVVAVFRQGEVVELQDTLMLEQGDDVLFIATPQAVQQVLVALGRYTHPNRRIIIAGGGHIGGRLAQQLENKYKIKVIDHSASTTDELADILYKSTILQGDIADRDLLLNENIEFTDVFCAVTNDDEANIMSCLQAKKLGARHTMALVNRAAYVELIEDSNIDHAISPQLITIGSILRKMRRGNTIKVFRLQNNEGEVIELVVNGDEMTSNVVGRKLDEIVLPPTCSLVALVRGDTVIMASNDTRFEAGDHVVLMALKKRYVQQLESLFQVNLNFMG
jgi:trk system potassium uptake protein TrkA